MTKKRWGLVSLIGMLIITLLLMITGWQPHEHRHQRPIRVVTSLNFYGEVAQSVAGKYGHVTTFIDNSAVDIHDFQPSTKQAQQLSQANVVVENGLGYDEWLTKMTQATDHDQTVINVGRQVAHKHAGDNEHVWYDPTVMSKLALALAKQYSRLDPQHRQYYYRQARQYQQKLQPLNQTITQAKSNVVADQRKVLVSEPVFDYALANLGYQVTNPQFAKAIEDGNDPSPKEIARMQTEIKNHEVAFLVNNKQESSSTVDNMLKLARQKLPILNVTETKPAHQTYVEWMQAQYNDLIKIQQTR